MCFCRKLEGLYWADTLEVYSTKNNKVTKPRSRTKKSKEHEIIANMYFTKNGVVSTKKTGCHIDGHQDDSIRISP